MKKGIREEAVVELSKRKRLLGESIPTFSYKISELVLFAYSTVDDPHRGTIAKDYFVNGLNRNMQIWVKSSPNYPTKTLKEISELATSFELVI